MGLQGAQEVRDFLIKVFFHKNWIAWRNMWTSLDEKTISGSKREEGGEPIFSYLQISKTCKN